MRTKLETETGSDRFAGAALLARLDNDTPRVLFSGGYGLADRENGVANTIDTRFRIGSMNKMFTAVAVLQLVQAGRIRLTDPVGRYIPGYPNGDVAGKVTIHQLLTHTGGTGDIFGPGYDAHGREMTTHDDWIGLYGERGPSFEPGTRYAYSNYGFVILGVVIERVSGESYYDYISENIYGPAGMTRSGMPPESIPDDLRTVGYSRLDGSARWTPTSSIVSGRGIAAGGGYSTVGDLLSFAEALMSDRLLNAEYTNLLITGKVDRAAASGTPTASAMAGRTVREPSVTAEGRPGRMGTRRSTRAPVTSSSRCRTSIHRQPPTSRRSCTSA